MSGMNAVLARSSELLAMPFEMYSQTVAFSHYMNVSAQLPIDQKTGKIVPGGAKEQAEQCFKNITAILESVDHALTDVVRVSVFLRNIMDLEAVDAVYRSFFTSHLPTRTTVAVAALPLGALVQVDALVTNGVGTIPNAPQAGDLVKLTNNTPNAPINALCTQTVAFSHYNNISAQFPIDPRTGTVVAGGVREQATQCLRNVKAILESIDVPFDDIVKTTVYLKDLADIDAFDQVYTTFFPDSSIARAVAYMPARTVVPVEDLPLHALVQIEVVVSHGDGTPPQAVEDRHGIVIKARNTDKAPKSDLSTQTVAFSHYNHLSAQLPIDPTSGNVVAGGVSAQAAQCFANTNAILESIGHSMQDVVKVNVFLANMADLPAVNEVCAAHFHGGVPACRVIGVSALPKNALIQIDVVVSNAEGTAR